ncbi:MULTISPECIES: hypothetical protein [unclassified Enterobacter]|uniref:hypothetical protein n=1 Tax=unclassified Enterobacter TaxID=2608935 RepID=UPI0011CD54D6|nr:MULTISPECIES: hypothetical protein [unclassified Enterobacter]
MKKIIVPDDYIIASTNLLPDYDGHESLLIVERSELRKKLAVLANKRLKPLAEPVTENNTYSNEKLIISLLTFLFVVKRS